MPANVIPFPGRFGEETGPAVRLTVGSAEAEILPFLGFNCVRWNIDGEPVYYAEPADTPNPSPTRSGHPILFPFPNRIRGGRFTHDGREFRLPPNDATKTHAIHGFTPRNPWRVTGSGADAGSAFVAAEFHLSRDLPRALSHWPADFVLTVTYRLFERGLRVEAEVHNPDRVPLPFGLGYHPYFCPPMPGNRAARDPRIDAAALHVGSKRLWESEQSLPTGRLLDAPPPFDFTRPRLVGQVALDHVYTDLIDLRPGDDLRTLAVLSSPAGGPMLFVRADDSFRELVLFTPVHRRAIAIEPYTCATDATNLSAQGLPAGWRVLPPGDRFLSAVEYRLGHEL
jgi:aldose 1-epimerase